MNKKFLLCLILCLAFMLLLCACQGQDSTAVQSESTAETAAQTESSSNGFLRIFASLFLLLFGVINLVMPRKFWDMTKGRNRKPDSKEPTVAELNGERVSGVLLIILGVFLYFGMIK